MYTVYTEPQEFQPATVTMKLEYSKVEKLISDGDKPTSPIKVEQNEDVISVAHWCQGV